MRDRVRLRFLIFGIAVLFLLTATMIILVAGPQGQANAPAGGQRGGEGRGRGRGAPNPLLSQPAPRLPDGTVNLGRVPGELGIWQLPYITNMGDRSRAVGAPPAPARGEGAARGGRGGGQIGGGEGTAGGGQRGGAPSEPWIPFQPWAAAFYNYNSLNNSKYDPEGYCLPPGGPRLFATPYPMEIIQQPELKRIIFIFEGGTHVWREIHMDGRSHAKADAIKGETWLGDSVGHWEGDTLVVDVVGFNEGTWLDYFGHPHTNQLHVVERFTRPNKGTLHYEATIDDPGAYTKPWTVAWDIPWGANAELQEYICQENNAYLNRLTDDFGQPIIGGK
ncbi:MAG: hypothetical protein DMG14_28685 [Acidobacteria bacterium]|nr:MAG: hypothetical protein DMG14_28685 [Acidobacteriota bacterium]